MREIKDVPTFDSSGMQVTMRRSSWLTVTPTYRRVVLTACLVLYLGLLGHATAFAQQASLQGQSTQLTSTVSASSTLTSTATLTATSALSTTTAVATPVASDSWLSSWLPSDPDETRKIVLTAVLTVLGTLFVVFFKKIAAATRDAADWAWRRLRVERAIEGTYLKKLAKELRFIQLFSMPEEKNLQTFYIPLRLVRWIEPDLRDQASSPVHEPMHLGEAMERHERITIVGNPGAGKTTVTSYAAAAIADHNLQINGKCYFPVYVQLRRLKEFLESKEYEAKSLVQLASEQIARYGFPEPEKFLERKLEAGECLLVLDGFDEIADREGILQLRLANKVRDLIESASAGNRTVLTSRSAGYVPAWFNGFRVLEMTELSLEQANQFISGWFGDERKDQSGALQKTLEKSDRLQLLVTNPLMLAIVCFVYSTKRPEDDFLPRRRVDLYDRCVEALIAKWDESRGVKRDAQFTPMEIETVLCHVAYDALKQERIDFSKKDLLALVRTHLPKIGRRQYEDEAFLEEVLEHTGLFKAKARDTIGFLHLTFQEYLAAKIIERKVLDGAEVKDVRAHIGDVISNAINPAWTEPIALAAGIMRGRSELVSELYALYKARSNPDLEMLLALCLRDADLEDFTIDPEYQIKRDEILSKLVETATEVVL